MKKNLLFTLGMAALFCVSASAQIKIKGVLNNNRYDDGEQLKTDYLGWNSELGKAVFIVDFGIYAMTWDGSTLSTPVKEPAVIKSEVKGNNEKEVWAYNFNLMYGNSGAVRVGNRIVTVMSRDYQSTEDNELFAVRKWDATTGDLLNNADEYMDVSANIESVGMSYNPRDGKVYGLFHITNAQLSEEMLNDPDYYVDQDDTDWGREGLDDGYAIGTIDLQTMQIKIITPGYYYQNFAAFAINSEGRAFALTTGGAAGYTDEDGKLRNADNELTGAQLIEFDLRTGLMKRITIKETVTDAETGEEYEEITYKYPFSATGYSSQVKRQAACFSKSNPNKMYWIGFYNSGKGINAWGSWGTLPDRDNSTGETWRDNHKYDTALYEIDLTSGDCVCTRVATIPNRCSFSCIWIDGDDCSDGVDMEVTGIAEAKTAAQNAATEVYNLQGQKLNNKSRGLNIIRQGNKTFKALAQ
jgi:hypothetical protein